MTLHYHVNFPDKKAAGIHPSSDEVSITVASGEPGGGQGEFEEHMRGALLDWFDGAGVDRADTPPEEGKQDPKLMRYVRAPEEDRRFARGDDFAGNAWRDTITGEIRHVAVGHDPNPANVTTNPLHLALIQVDAVQRALYQIGRELHDHDLDQESLVNLGSRLIELSGICASCDGSGMDGDPPESPAGGGGTAPCVDCEGGFTPSPGDARCNFCDGPMPCYCEPAGGAEIDPEADAAQRSKYDPRPDTEPA